MRIWLGANGTGVCAAVPLPWYTAANVPRVSTSRHGVIGVYTTSIALSPSDFACGSCGFAIAAGVAVLGADDLAQSVQRAGEAGGKKVIGAQALKPRAQLVDARCARSTGRAARPRWRRCARPRWCGAGR